MPELWLVLNEVAPVLFTIFAITYGLIAGGKLKIQTVFPGLFADGFLFFYVFILMLGLIFDGQRAEILGTPELTPRQSNWLLMGGVLLLVPSFVAYCAAQSNHHKDGPYKVRFALISVAIALIVSYAVYNARATMDLW